MLRQYSISKFVIGSLLALKFIVFLSINIIALEAHGAAPDLKDGASHFFRLKAQYSHRGKPIAFNIVAACYLRENIRSPINPFLAIRYPRFFILPTHNNHEVMQIVPIACQGETTKDGRVPSDFLPGAVWFDTPGDYRFGTAYLSEDAFKSPKSNLIFHGATIQTASRKEWLLFRTETRKNPGMSRFYYKRSAQTWQQIAKGTVAGFKAAYADKCSGVRRYRLSESGRAILRKYWPAGKPRYWANNADNNRIWHEILKLDAQTPVFANGKRYDEHLRAGGYRIGGFPTREGGGMVASQISRIIPPDFFPVRDDRGLPWVFTAKVANSTYLTKEAEVSSGVGQGFLYCYSNLRSFLRPLRNFHSRPTQFLVDGEPVAISGDESWPWPSPFFENDEYVYLKMVISLH